MNVIDWIISGALGGIAIVLILATLKSVISPYLGKDLLIKMQLASKQKDLESAKKETLIGDARALNKLFFLSTKRIPLSLAEKVHDYNLEVLSFVVSRAPSARDLPNLSVVEELFYNRFLAFQQLDKAHALKAKISAYNSKIKKGSFDEPGSISSLNETLSINRLALEKEINTLLEALNGLLSHHEATIH